MSLPKDVYIYLAEFRYQLRKFLNFSEKASREIGTITPQQHQLLLVLMGYPNRNFATPSELSERLQITHHACVGLIDRCEDVGLVKRKKNPDDGRSVLVEITDKGETIIETLSEIHLQEIKRIHILKDFDLDNILDEE